MLYLSPALIADLYAETGQGRAGRELAFPTLRDPQAAQVFTQLFHAVTRANPDALLAETNLLRLVARLGDAPIPTPRPLPAAIRRARQRIDDDPAAPIRLADLACDAGLSRFQVIRAFTAATGLPPHAYLVQRRIHLARRLIATGLSLAQTAAAAGFADQSHMTRAFRSCHGLTPGAWARNFVQDRAILTR